MNLEVGPEAPWSVPGPTAAIARRNHSRPPNPDLQLSRVLGTSGASQIAKI
jgi:hypothetical protein